MNAPSDLSMKTEEVLRVELEVFRREHRDLDEAIHALVDRGTADQLTLQRLKKRKLRLKDMTPDITA
jgi:hypothetical protein